MDNVSYIESLYRQWEKNPSAVGAAWDAYFREAARPGAAPPQDAAAADAYEARLRQGLTTLASQLVDSPRFYKTAGEDEQTGGEVWNPKNYGNKLLGRVSLRKALVKSLNLPTIGLTEDLGPKRIADYAKRVGIEAEIDAQIARLAEAEGDRETEVRSALDANRAAGVASCAVVAQRDASSGVAASSATHQAARTPHTTSGNRIARMPKRLKCRCQ